MIQIGVILIAMAVATFVAGNPVLGLMGLAAGLFFISTRKANLGMKVTLKSLVTPVDDSAQAGVFDIAARLSAYAAFAAAIVVAAAMWLDGLG